MNLTLRPGRPDDAERCGLILYEAFKCIADQHNFPPDFPDSETAVAIMASLLSQPAYSVVGEVDGRVVGSNFLWEGSIAGIGPITVDPEVQNKAIGRRLMQAVLERVEATKTRGVRLVQAAYHNRSLGLYAKLGFDVREPLCCIQGPPLNSRIPGCEVRTISERDLESCNAICRAVHGHDRGIELRSAVSRGGGRVVERGGRITGYATMIGFFGHAVGETDEDIRALIASTLSFAGPGFLLPSRNTELLRWCLANGLRIVQPMTLMTRGFYQEPAGSFLPSILF